MEWRHKNSPPPRKFKVVPSAGKLMATIFWDQDGIIHIDYLPRQTTITGAYYADLLKCLRQSIKEKRRGKLGLGVLLQQDNAPAHASQVATVAARDCGFEVLPHPLHSPDLGPSDYHLSENLKKNLRGRRFRSDKEFKCAVQVFFEDQEKDFFFTGINALHTRWQRCIDIQGDYIEK